MKRTPVALREWGGTALVAIPFVAVCAIESARLNIWIDEAYTLHTTQGSLSFAIGQALHVEQQAPLYFAIINLWRHINTSDAFVRSFSALSIAAILFVLHAFARRHLRVPPLLVVAFVAVNPLALWMGSEARLYAFATLLSAALTSLFFTAFLQRPASARARIAYAALAIAAMYTQYYLGFLFVGSACALALLRRWRALRDYLATMVVVALPVLPLLRIARAQVASSGTGDFRISFLGAAHELLATEANALWAREWFAHTRFEPLLDAVIVALIVAAIVVARRTRRTEGEREPLADAAALWTIVAVATVLFGATDVLLREQVVLPRHIVGIFPPLVLGTFALIGASPARGRRAILALFLLAAIPSALVGSATLYPDGAKEGDWKRVDAYVEAAVGPDEPIAVFSESGALAFLHYFHGANIVVPLPRALDFSFYDRRQYRFLNERQVARAFSPTARARTVWFVERDPCVTKYWETGCAYLDAYVSHTFVKRTERHFLTTVVYRLERKTTL